MNYDFTMGKVQAAQHILAQASVVMHGQMKKASEEAVFAMNRLLNQLADERDRKPAKKRRTKKHGGTNDGR